MKIKELSKEVVRLISRLFWLFKLDNNKVFLMNFDGTIIGHDAKAVVDYCRENGIGMDFVWGAKDKALAQSMRYEGVRFVPIDSLRGWYEMLTAKTLLYNINPPSYLSFRKSQILINTWHGFIFKAVGKYIGEIDRRQFNTTTCFVSDAEFFTTKAIRDAFEYKGEVLECGTPRTDILFSERRDRCAAMVKKSLGVSPVTKLALFAPTFRGDFRYDESQLDVRRLKKSLTSRFGGEWEVLLKVHPMIAKEFCSRDMDGLDVSWYEDTQELLCASDALVTDYSSISWEFALLKRPIFIYAYDANEYKTSRTLFVPMEQWPFPIAASNDELGERIAEFDEEAYVRRVEAFQKEKGCFDTGKACHEVLRYMATHGAKLRKEKPASR
ncbi:MAG: CDP-glycerol glycerophosphotransferase family protein [Lachnospiraceae bacterium]|nr:CDP-glycerol glycerophosphotransferase family protein [Lachnospiraceae bacterium]